MNECKNIIFKALVGSRAYGTNVPGSDYDYKGVFIAPHEDILTNSAPDQIETSKDETYYEVGRFLNLLATGNPTMIELLFTPMDCTIIQTPIFKEILRHKDKFLTKKLANSFCGYAHAQISKAKALDKKMNWEAKRIERKTPVDFCYVVVANTHHTFKLTEYMNNCHRHDWRNHFGVIKAEHTADGYFLYNKSDCLSFHPIVSDNGNSLKCSAIKKDVAPICYVYFNKSEYTRHCKEYKEYNTWLKERNVQRYVDVDAHGQKIDGKNMLHCVRLIDMALEIAQGKGCKVRRENAEYLKDIRHGKVDLASLVDYADNKLQEVRKAFDDSDLPDEVDAKFLKELLLNIRILYYGNKREDAGPKPIRDKFHAKRFASQCYSRISKIFR